MPLNVPATCHTSALMNRNVVNSSSNGIARITTLNSSGSWAVVRCPAHRSNGSTP